MKVAAAMGLLGLPAHRFLTTNDSDEALVLYAVALEGMKLFDTAQRNLAAHIVSTYAKASRRGS